MSTMALLQGTPVPLTQSHSRRPLSALPLCPFSCPPISFRYPHRRSHLCRAEERSRDRTQTRETEKIQVPDTPPAQDSSRRTSDGASTSEQPTAEISEELKMLQQRKRDSQQAAPSGYFQSVLQEVRLIEWPRPRQAVVNTVLVIGIVGASTLFLLLLNSSLAEISKVAYR